MSQTSMDATSQFVKTERRRFRIANISLYNVFAAIAFLLFFEPTLFVYRLPKLSVLYGYARLAMSVTIILVYALHRLSRRTWPGLPFIITLSYQMILLYTTYRNGGHVAAARNYMVTYPALVALCEMLLEKSVRRFVNIITPIINMMIYLNFLTVLLYPGGMYETTVSITHTGLVSYVNHYKTNWLLGYDNTFVVYMLPAMLMSLVRYHLGGGRHGGFIKVVALFVVCILTTLIGWQAGTLVCITVFCVACAVVLINRQKGQERLSCIINSWNAVIANIVFFVGIVIYQMQFLFQGFIEKVLHKNLTFSTRTSIWANSFLAIAKSPLFGYGIEDVSATVSKLSLNSTHNHYLWIVYMGGACLFTAFALLLVLIAVRLYKYRKHSLIIIAAASLFCILLMWQMEAIYTYSLFTYLSFLYYLPYYLREERPGGHRKLKIRFFRRRT